MCEARRHVLYKQGACKQSHFVACTAAFNLTPTKPAAVYQNAYETISSWSGVQTDCGVSSVCCTDANSNNVQFDLNFNATNYIAYDVMIPASNDFELSITVATIDESFGEQLFAASVSLQPWQAVNYSTGSAAASASSPQLANLMGSVTLTGVLEENYEILTLGIPSNGLAYTLLQTSLDDEGVHVCMSCVPHTWL